MAYIDREAAIAETRKPRLTDAELRRRLAELPAADVEPVKHGHWVDVNGNSVPWSGRVAHCPAYSAYCSECRQWLVASDEYTVVGNYCPNCGARMEEDN